MLNLSTSSMTVAYMCSTQDWLIIGGIALVMFGGAKIPQLAHGLGEGIREFKKSMSGDEPVAATTALESSGK
jgi:sec-independent protein translocase protein TatA